MVINAGIQWNNGASLTEEFTKNATDPRREYTIQMSLLNSYTTNLEPDKSRFQGMSLKERRDIIAEEVDQSGQLANASNILETTESIKLEVRLLSRLNLTNEKARDVRKAYEDVHNQARPVTNYRDARDIRYDRPYMNQVEAGYNKSAHTLRMGDIVYDLKALNNKSIRNQFEHQFINLKNPSKFAYVKDDLGINQGKFATVNDQNQIKYLRLNTLDGTGPSQDFQSYLKGNTPPSLMIKP